MKINTNSLQFLAETWEHCPYERRKIREIRERETNNRQKSFIDNRKYVLTFKNETNKLTIRQTIE